MVFGADKKLVPAAELNLNDSYLAKNRMTNNSYGAIVNQSATALPGSVPD